MLSNPHQCLIFQMCAWEQIEQLGNDRQHSTLSCNPSMNKPQEGGEQGGKVA